ncbi:MAG: hypothetical protein CMJ78_04765 [Planctomycetaceae bacterium]|nr:hypothetical protein [Planctomycetaceae bacterium]
MKSTLNSLRIQALLLSLVAIIAAGCDSDSELSAFDNEQQILRELRRLGTDVEPVSDARIETGTYMVTLYREHLTEEGLIEEKVYVQLIRLRKLILGLNNTHIDDTGFAKIQRMENLFGLNLHNTQITDTGLTQLGGFPTLRLLKLDNTNITSDGIRRLGEFPNLSMLYLSKTQITDGALEGIAELPKLEAWKLSSTRITDDGIEHLKQAYNLAYLGLDNTNVTEKGVRHLVGLPELTYLNLKNTKVTAEKRGYYQSVFPDCKVVF